jgi:hypothetical protein
VVVRGIGSDGGHIVVEDRVASQRVRGSFHGHVGGADPGKYRAGMALTTDLAKVKWFAKRNMFAWKLVAQFYLLDVEPHEVLAVCLDAEEEVVVRPQAAQRAHPRVEGS